MTEDMIRSITCSLA